MCADSSLCCFADMLAVIASVPTLVLSSVWESKFLTLRGYYYRTFFPQGRVLGCWLRFWGDVREWVVVGGWLKPQWSRSPLFSSGGWGRKRRIFLWSFLNFPPFQPFIDLLQFLIPSLTSNFLLSFLFSLSSFNAFIPCNLYFGTALRN